MSKRRYNDTRVKIDSPDLDMIDKIIEALRESFLCLPGPVRDSAGGGYHVFVNVEARE